MQNILQKSYKCLIFIFFILFILLIRLDAQENLTIFSVGLLIGGIVLSVIPFMINNCKKIAVRRWYLMSFVSLGLFIVIQATFFLLFAYKNLADIVDSDILFQVFVWLLIFIQAVFFCFSACTIIYEVKDFFKKDYTIQKFDIDAFEMILNLITYIAVIYIVFDASGYEIVKHFDMSFKTFFTFTFGDYSIVLNGLLIVLAVYVLAYSALQIIKSKKFK